VTEPFSISSPVRVGLIGMGYAGRTIHAPLIASVDGLQLVAVASRDAARVHATWPSLRVVPEYGELAADPAIDLVVIATPNDSHHPLAHAALLAGKHVVIDKPFAVTLAQCDELAALAQAQQRVLSVFHNRRWDGDFLALQRVIASGVLGEVRELISRLHRFEPTPRVRWRETPGPGSGLWFDFGPHLIDQALRLFGAPLTVAADLAALREGASEVDYAQVVLGYERRRVTLHCTRLAAHAAARFEAHGSKGSFHCEGWDLQEAQLKAGMSPGASGWGEDPRPVFVTDGLRTPPHVEPQPRARGDYRSFYTGVLQAILTGAANPVPVHEARQVMAVLECAVQSAAQGRTLPFASG
jgi:predicted dehydrogenase